MTIASIISAKGNDVHTVTRTAALSKAIRALGEHNIGALIVVDDDGQCCGILSERDVVRRLATAESPADYLAMAVESSMTADVHTCGMATTVDEAMGMMTERRIRHLPVVEDGKLSGIVSIGDIVKRKISATEREAEELRSYIATG